MEIWNNKFLNPPPTNSFRTKRKDIDILHLNHLCQDAKRFYSEQQHLHVEAALLSRCIYRMKMKFRSAKDFKSLEKVNKALLNYLQMDLPYTVSNFSDLLTNNNINHEKELYVPSRNMLDYVLVRMQGLVQLMCRVVEMCRTCMQHFEVRLRIGHCWNIATIAIGLVCRVHILSINIIEFTCNLYTRLLPYCSKLKNVGLEWLPTNYKFPKDLRDWLNVDWLQFVEEVVEIPDISDFSRLQFFDLIGEDSDDDIEICNEYIEIKDNDDEDLEIVKEYKHICESRRLQNQREPIVIEDISLLRRSDIDDIDIGEIIETDSDSSNSIELIENQANNRKRKSNVNVEQLQIDSDSVEEVNVNLGANGNINRLSKTVTNRSLEEMTKKQKVSKKRNCENEQEITYNNLSNYVDAGSCVSNKNVGEEIIILDNSIMEENGLNSEKEIVRLDKKSLVKLNKKEVHSKNMPDTNISSKQKRLKLKNSIHNDYGYSKNCKEIIILDNVDGEPVDLDTENVPVLITQIPQRIVCSNDKIVDKKQNSTTAIQKKIKLTKKRKRKHKQETTQIAHNQDDYPDQNLHRSETISILGNQNRFCETLSFEQNASKGNLENSLEVIDINKNTSLGRHQNNNNQLSSVSQNEVKFPKKQKKQKHKTLLMDKGCIIPSCNSLAIDIRNKSFDITNNCNSMNKKEIKKSKKRKKQKSKTHLIDKFFSQSYEGDQNTSVSNYSIHNSISTNKSLLTANVNKKKKGKKKISPKSKKKALNVTNLQLGNKTERTEDISFQNKTRKKNKKLFR